MPILVGPVCVVALLASVLLGTDRLAFRDVSYFYTPLYDYVAKRCAEHPFNAFGAAIWNPLDLTGMSLAGETTTAVFYPVRMLVYAADWTAETSISVYVAVHLILASLSANWLARTYRCRPWSAAIAGIVYPLSGTVLFLATNPPFLVSAAWLPFLMGALLRPSVAATTVKVHLTARLANACHGVPLASVAMAMMILGGDPSTAFHAVLMLGLVSLSRLLVQWLVSLRAKNKRGGWLIGRTITTCAIAAALSAPQLAASIDWSRQSDRVSMTGNRAVQRSNAFAFSFPAWRIAEFGIPNLYGTPWPVHHRWDRIAFEREGGRPDNALWTPTVYMGASAWLFASVLIARFGKIGFKRAWLRWLRSSMAMEWTVIGSVSLLASMGSYTPLYGWMMDWIPGYDALRYPSKWLPFVTLSLALGLARGALVMELGASVTAGKPCPSVVRWAWRTFIGLLVVLVVLSAVVNRLPQASGVADYYWGPFQIDLAKSAYLATSTHWFVVVVGLGSLGWGLRHAKSAGARRRWVPVLVIVVAADLVFAHHDLVPRINRIAEHQRLQTSPDFPGGMSWMNTLPRGGALPRWQALSSVDRMVEVEATLRSSWFGRWHLENNQAKFNSLVSIRPAAVAEFWVTARQVTANQSPQQRQRQWDRWMSQWNIVGSIVRQDGEIRWEPVRPSSFVEPPAMIVPEDSIEVHLQRPETIRRVVYQDGNWTATALAIGTSDASPIELNVRPEGSLAQSILVPAGDWRIQWRYSPWWFFPTISLALVTWFSIAASVYWKRFIGARTGSVDRGALRDSLDAHEENHNREQKSDRRADDQRTTPNGLRVAIFKAAAALPAFVLEIQP
ncbi:hypothetical protein [Neorhodopirellula pilleata]|uniref:Bacterial membrane protein YfhO n=1 Tax=Neorhodopirellula pilleata TaxID=2714738 RepID=A0A5C6AWQ5_9BACT|nr:hypothetical protein [Neorhodopirellula pilleata]TWU03901.1 hypothetical protein Pla100_08360 [Neorhodopirellula pilleata]